MHHLPLRSLPGVSKVAKASVQHCILRSRIFKTLLQAFLHGDSKLLSTRNENRRSACVNQIFTCLVARLRNRDWAPLKPHQHAIPAQAKTAWTKILQDGYLLVNDALHHKLWSWSNRPCEAIFWRENSFQSCQARWLSGVSRSINEHIGKLLGAFL